MWSAAPMAPLWHTGSKSGGMAAALQMRRALLLALILTACTESARLPVEAGQGPNPQLPAAKPQLIPTVNIAPAKGWPPGTIPTAASGLTVTPFAVDLDHPRWLYVLPNGDVLVAETNAPERPEENKGIRAWFMRRIAKKAGSATKSANRITLAFARSSRA